MVQNRETVLHGVYWARPDYKDIGLEGIDPRKTPFAYFMHERCWYLAKITIRSSVLENNLGLFIATPAERWPETEKNLLGSEYESFLYGFTMDRMEPETFFKDPQMHAQKHLDYLQTKMPGLLSGT